MLLLLVCYSLSVFEKAISAWDLALTQMVEESNIRSSLSILFKKLKLKCGRFAPFCGVRTHPNQYSYISKHHHSCTHYRRFQVSTKHL